MRIRKIADITKEMDGETIGGISGTVQTIGKRFAGTNDHGDWSLQSAVLKDGDAEISLLFSGREALNKDELLRKSVTIVANDKGKGLKVEMGEPYKERPAALQIRIFQSAEICPGIKQGAVETPKAEPPKTPPPKAEAPKAEPPKAATPPAQNAPTAPEVPVEDKRRIIQIANLYQQCFGAAHHLSLENGWSSDQQQAAASSIFIRACQKGMDDNMPKAFIKKG